MGESFWKKEISLGRKSKPASPSPEAADDRPAAVERVLAPPVKQSVWKKEISLGRKSKPAPGDTPAAATPAPAPAPAGERQSIWKKEIAFGRKPKAEASPAPVPAPEQTPVAAPVAYPAPAAPVELPAAVEHVLAPPVPAAVTTPAPAHAPYPAPPAPDPVVPAPTVPAAPATPVPTEAVVVVEPAAPSVTAPQPAPPVAPEPAPAPVVAAVPAPAPAPAPVAVPAAVPAPAPEPQPAAAVPAAAPGPAPAVSVPFWKKNISFGRKPKQAPASAPAEVAVVPGAKKAPFWKKHLSLGRGSEPKADVLRDEQPKAPFWKRELGGRKAKADSPKPEKGPKPEKAPKVPKVRGGGGRNAKRVVGLKVGASQVAAASVDNSGVAELLQLAREPIEPGIVVGGELRDPDALAEALKRLFKRHKLPKKGVRLGIANNRIGVRTFDIGGIEDPKQLANAIRFRAQEVLPIPIDEAVLDYRILGETTDAEGNTVRRVLLVIAYRELIDRYVEACRKAGITLSGIDLEAFAILRAMSAPRPDDEAATAAVVVVAIGHDRSTFAVSDGRFCEFTRVLDWGGSALDVAIARALDQTPSEAEPVKRALSLLDEAVPDGMADAHAQAARAAMRKQIQGFARELVSSLQFYQSQPGSHGIGEIVLTGGTAQLPGLAEELQRLIGVRVRVGDPLARMKVAKRIGETDQIGSLAVAIGLGIED